MRLNTYLKYYSRYEEENEVEPIKKIHYIATSYYYLVLLQMTLR